MDETKRANLQRIHKEIIKAIEKGEGVAVTEILISVKDLELLDSFLKELIYKD